MGAPLTVPTLRAAILRLIYVPQKSRNSQSPAADTPKRSATVRRGRRKRKMGLKRREVQDRRRDRVLVVVAVGEWRRCRRWRDLPEPVPVEGDGLSGVG